MGGMRLIPGRMFVRHVRTGDPADKPVSMLATIDFKISLQIQVRQDGDAWVAWCLALDVHGQGRTRAEAVASLEGSVMAWFESCIERGVLPEALKELGFQSAAGEAAELRYPAGVDRLDVLVPGYLIK